MTRFDLTGKTVLITGATDGLGRALARVVLDAGATVLVHGRSPERMAATVAELDGGDRVRAYRADFASLAQVHELADAVLDAEPTLDVLVNNAGIGTRTGQVEERELSADGHELRFAVNYLAGFALTERLRGRLSPARIVNVSSLGQQAIDFDDVLLEHGYSGVRAYCQSKLAQILYTFSLAEAGEVATALHPATYMPTKMVPSPISTLGEGVEATYRLIADPALDAVTGRFYDGLREAQPDPQAADAQARGRLWELSQQLTARGR
ncbi:MAG TPA: SDR family NAD(P)-dependent oxidoreductase [Baekduia sp.]|nr:SDR family NAD(P)-dependent oxidoreductase [Baekduia sp.]